MLVSIITTTERESDNAWMVILLRYHKWLLILWLFFLFKGWNEKQLGNISISLFPSENSQLKEEKEEKFSLHLLFMSIREPLMIECYLGISLSSNSWWGSWLLEFLESRIKLMMWFGGNKCAHRWNLLLSFCKWKWMGIRLAMASISNIGDIWNAPMIYITAFLCIFLSFLSGYANGTLL